MRNFHIFMFSFSLVFCPKHVLASIQLCSSIKLVYPVSLLWIWQINCFSFWILRKRRMSYSTQLVFYCFCFSGVSNVPRVERVRSRKGRNGCERRWRVLFCFWQFSWKGEVYRNSTIVLFLIFICRRNFIK